MAKAQTLTALKGMNDLFPPETARWEWLEEKVREQMARFAYQNVRLPILERTELFVRGIGEVTDVVEKEMYAFADRADKHGEFDHVSLRPEGTAGVVRAVTEQNLLRESPLRLWYCGPMFRRENVQRGRLKDFCKQHKVKFEAGKNPWHVPADIALPCATQNELDAKDAKHLIANGVISYRRNYPVGEKTPLRKTLKIMLSSLLYCFCYHSCTFYCK